MFDCAETPYTISLNFIPLLRVVITPSNRMKFRLLTRCGNGINLVTRQSISWCSWRPKHCLRASLALTVGSHPVRKAGK